MFQFEHDNLLFYLAIIPVLALLFWLAKRARQQALSRFGHLTVLQQLMPDYSQNKHTAKFILLLLAIALLVVAWANPQLGSKREKVERKSVSIFIALDISRSMNAEDIAPSRLERAKQFAMTAVRQLSTERIGLIIFAGNAYVQTPLTDDYTAVNTFLKSANTNMVSNQGTALASAIELVQESFEIENKASKAIFIISDGETHDEAATQQAKAAYAEGILTFTIGVGTPDGAPVPTSFRGKPNYLYDDTGNPVVSKLNETMLRNLAKAGGGAYYNLNSGNEAILNDLRTKIDRMEKQTYEQRVFEAYESYFQIPTAIALLLILIEFLISYQKDKYLAAKDWFS